MKKKKIVSILFLLAITLTSLKVHSQNERKVVLQAFWWNYYNNNYPEGWSNYLIALAPRLQALGIDAIWIPPATKGNTGTESVGYDVFDHYDLGDKYQKGTTPTRMGTKDELLRLVAVMHAYGIEVIADVVPNHVTGAGSSTGAGGIDPMAWGDQYKNFRYTCFQTPSIDESAGDYLSRQGRFSKNWQNFNPNPAQPSENYPFYNQMFGPDVSYEAGSYGQSSNAIFNPLQGENHMRNGMRDWLRWYYKQVGFDGVRLDAAKHYPAYVTEDLLWNLQNNVNWASPHPPSWNTQGDDLFAVSEYVQEPGYDMDAFCDASQNRTGTFDFNLRDGLYEMSQAGGFFDMSTLPSRQQNNRNRTVPFVNNHDTFRPMLDGSGNYIGWNVGDELRPHLDPFNPRMITAYAMALAVDGSPQIFFEDLFNIGGTGMRWSHDPANLTELPVRPRLENLLWCRKALNFSDGNYIVSTVSGAPSYSLGSTPQDLLVIERDPAGDNNSLALIGINDNGANWQQVWVTTDFPVGTTLIDYSGANGAWSYVVPNDKRVPVNVPPANQQYGGYCVIAPKGQQGESVASTPEWTWQEWEMANDLGDSHPQSLEQGGALPAFDNTTWRTVGNIYLGVGRPVNVLAYQERVLELGLPAIPVDVEIVRTSDGTVVDSYSGLVNGWCMTYLASTEGYYTLRVKNANAGNASQRLWVRATYALTTNLPDLFASIGKPGSLTIKTSSATKVEESKTTLSLSTSPNPLAAKSTIYFTIPNTTSVKLTLLDKDGKTLSELINCTMDKGSHKIEIDLSSYSTGTYICRLETAEGTLNDRLIIER
ncbi:T9SS C-terminal target domain-containing protein [Chryseotalea sanaruensis]|uniref:T9SS C-terminal target domain-containing protein n=1 Tax=Chryseotalea sanaruensis TaxID=2482724 RepID=A0A401UFH3_9BACT|nr:alpha-amylase domain-containing protein [Chryseotalea sanaruensis]GCC53669.1 T9SS C-terminal target domain-containing protein [Chryseotalea sanaruensis]